jgi:hypothetical protein
MEGRRFFVPGRTGGKPPALAETTPCRSFAQRGKKSAAGFGHFPI